MLYDYRLFLDDTGTHAGAPVCGVTGYLATGEQWAAFSREWCDALPADLRDGRFRFTEFVRDVERGRRDPESLRPLIEVIRAHVRCGVTRLLHMDSYRMVPEKYLRVIGHPYRFCLFLVLDAILEELGNLSDLPAAERLVTIANSQPGMQSRTLTLWNRWVRQADMERRVEPIDFQGGRDYPPLQAADFFAHTAFRVTSGPPPFPGLSKRPSFPLSIYGILQPFLTAPQPPHYEGVVTYERLVENYPRFEALLWRMEEGDDPDDPLTALLRKADQG